MHTTCSGAPLRAGPPQQLGSDPLQMLSNSLLKVNLMNEPQTNSAVFMGKYMIRGKDSENPKISKLQTTLATN
jgi:hypothetical protein